MERNKKMSTINKLAWLIALAAVMLLLGIYYGSKMMSPNIKVEENSNIVVEKIEKVAKLITIEAHLSEIYNYKDYYNYDLSFLRKKALLRVNAKVSAGYDLKKMKIDVDKKKKIINVGPIPDAEILSIDHNLDYFDIEEGIFNSFSPNDYNHINNNAKEYVKRIASNSEVIKQANEQKNTMVDLMTGVAISMGYRLNVIRVDQKQ